MSEVVLKYESVYKLVRGLEAITAAEFAQILRDCLRADDWYISQTWPQFHRNRLAYMYSRNPDIQGRMLFQKALDHMNEDPQ